MKGNKYQFITERKIYKYRKHRPQRVKARYGKNRKKRSCSLKFFFSYSLNNLIKNSRTISLNCNKIIIPRTFSFYDNFNESMLVFRQILSLFLKKEGDITIDFSQCEHTCLSVLSLLTILYDEFLISQYRYKRIDKFYQIRKLKINPSFRDLKVKKYLHALGLYEYNDFKDEDGEVLSLDLIRGKYRNSYQENVKAKAINQIVEFINESFSPVNKCLTQDGLNTIESLVSEITSVH